MSTYPEPVTSRALAPAEVLSYATSLAEALRRLHRNGAVFGRLDPAHIVWDDGHVKLARQDAASSPAYLAPEQVRGEPADARSDIFAFGAILYEVLSGSKAFPATNPEDLKKQILECSPAPLTGIPESLSALINGCLQREPEHRWQR